MVKLLPPVRNRRFHFHFLLACLCALLLSSSFSFASEVPPDMTSPPTLFSVSNTQVIIRWETNVPTTSVVQYGLSDDYGSEVSVPDLTEQHEVVLTGLTPGTFYHYRALSYEAEKSQVPVTSSDQQFTTEDAYFGWDVVKGQATGYFHIENIEGRDRLITPDGKSFYYLGVNKVWPYNLENFQEKYHGSYTAWSEKAIYDLKKWNFHNLGDRADAAAINAASRNRLPYTYMMNFIPNESLDRKYPDDFPDPWDPAFLAAIEAEAERVTTKRKSDPYLLGYFNCNEPDLFVEREGDSQNNRWVRKIVDQPAGTPGKEVFVSGLQGKYGTIEEFNKAYAASYLSWDEVKNASFVDLYGTRSYPYRTGDVEDLHGLNQLIARQFFSTTYQAIRSRDPNHLILGHKMMGNDMEAEVIVESGQYADAFSINKYTYALYQGDIDRWSRLAKKPLLISEFSFLEVGHEGTYPSSDNQTDRAGDYKTYLTAAMSFPNILGVGWHEYTDPRSDQWGYMNFGILNRQDEEYQDFVEPTMGVNQAIYGTLQGDVTSPVIREMNPPDQAVVYGAFLLTATVEDQGSGIARVDAYQGDTFLGMDAAAPYQFHVNTEGMGQAFSVTVKAYDVAGNMGTSQVSYAVDGTAPHVTTSSPLADAVDQSLDVPVSLTFSERLKVGTVVASNFSVEGSVSGQHVLNPVMEEREGETGVALNAAGTFAKGERVTVQATEGLQDMAGNAATPYLFTFKTILPETISVGAVQLADPTSGSIEFTNDLAVQTTSQDIGGKLPPEQMMISEYPDFSGAVWQAFSNPSQFELSSGDAKKTVYYKVKNADQVESNVVNAAILLDVTLPSVTVASPSGGGLISGMVEMQLAVEDIGSGVAQTSAAAGDTQFPPDSEAPYTVTLDSSQFPDGLLEVSVSALDFAGNAISSHVTYGVDNGAPTAPLPTAPQGILNTATITFSWGPSEDPNLKEYILTLDGVELARITELSFLKERVQEGSHTWSVTAVDQVGHQTASETFSFLVDTILPAVSIITPKNGAVVSGELPLQASGEDSGSGLVSITAYIDSVLFWVDTQSPYQGIWDSKTVSDGVHVIRAEAKDQAGNTQVQEVVVTVRNIRIDKKPPILKKASVTSNQFVSSKPEFSFEVADEETRVSRVKVILKGPKTYTFQSDGLSIQSVGTQSWEENETEARFSIQLVEELPTGTYELLVEVEDEEGNVSTSSFDGLTVSSAQGIAAGTIPLAYPNPYSPARNGQVDFTYTLTANGDITLYLFDLNARLLLRKQLGSGTVGGSAGFNRVSWDGRTDLGEVIGAGGTILKVVSGGKVIGSIKLAVIY